MSLEKVVIQISIHTYLTDAQLVEWLKAMSQKIESISIVRPEKEKESCGVLASRAVRMRALWQFRTFIETAPDQGNPALEMLRESWTEMINKSRIEEQDRICALFLDGDISYRLMAEFNRWLKR